MFYQEGQECYRETDKVLSAHTVQTSPKLVVFLVELLVLAGVTSSRDMYLLGLVGSG